ncbi:MULTISPECIES: ABC transporter substrate-binding protein [unclassified Ruminococcus]|uniref:ABC transporter substrate-binding protein n=1 Tax=unclassified Ruminococcus TaxID=2608920 RepID=UPI00210A2CB2|nr:MULTISPECIES: ABC transporter substrate-binding protein [unclassified Ruminococcus]
MKKVLCLVLALLTCLVVFAGCSGGSSSAGSSSDTSSNNQSTGDKVKIGIIKVVEHTSLNTIEESIIKQLNKLGYVDGENAEIKALSAQNDPSNVPAMMDSFVADNTDIVIAITTPVASVALNYADQVPVLFSAVSNPVEAGLTTTLEKPDKNVTGTCDAVPVEKIFDMALELTPDIKTVGLIYNSAEDSSVANIENAKKYCDKIGLKYVEANVENSSAIQQAAESLVTKCDAVFSPTDNTVAEGMAVLSQVCADAKIPCYVGADSMVKDGGFATIGIKYEDLGIETANMAKKVLDGTKISDIPVLVFDDLSTYVNTTIAEKIGVELPESLLNNEKTVVFE